MKIAFIMYQGNMFSGGQGIYTYYLTRELARLGHEVHVIAGPPYPRDRRRRHLPQRQDRELLEPLPQSPRVHAPATSALALPSRQLLRVLLDAHRHLVAAAHLQHARLHQDQGADAGDAVRRRPRQPDPQLPASLDEGAGPAARRDHPPPAFRRPAQQRPAGALHLRDGASLPVVPLGHAGSSPPVAWTASSPSRRTPRAPSSACSTSRASS